MPSRSIIRTGVGRIGSQGIASRPWRRRSISSPRERLAFSRDETSVDPSARSSITPTQSLHSIVRGRALTISVGAKSTAPDAVLRSGAVAQRDVHPSWQRLRHSLTPGVEIPLPFALGRLDRPSQEVKAVLALGAIERFIPVPGG